MIIAESDNAPDNLAFEIAVVAVGYESRCQWVTSSNNIIAEKGLGFEFGFLREAAYEKNRTFFEDRGFEIVHGVEEQSPAKLAQAIQTFPKDDRPLRIFVDVSSMSREMIANIVLGIEHGRSGRVIELTIAYAPSKFGGKYYAAPIRRAAPIKPQLAGWSSRPEQPLGAIFGLGCEPGLALGALQFLEPNNAWIFGPSGNDPEYDQAMEKANEHIGDIFDVTEFTYHIRKPTITRGKLEALINAIEDDFRIIVVPFGPKIFAWLAISTAVFTRRSTVGVWAFSSKEQAIPADREAEGPVVWHRMTLA